MGNTEPINFKVAPELKAAIQRYATEHHMSQAVAIRLLLEAGLHAQAPQPRQSPEPRTSYGERRPYTVADNLDDLNGPTSGVVRLPHHLNWSGSPVYNLDNPDRLAEMYATVLREASTPDDIPAHLNRHVLVRLWPTLGIPKRVRQLWRERFPELPAEDTSWTRSTNDSPASASPPENPTG